MPRRKTRVVATRKKHLTHDGIGTLLRDDATTLASSALPLMQVAVIQRCTLDADRLGAMREQVRPELADAYDVQLSDGIHKLKCALSTSLNTCVYSGWLRPRAFIYVTGWRRIVDERLETGMRPPPVVVITSMRAGRCPGDPTEGMLHCPSLPYQ